jgi:excisionase family DNA binding protein
LSPISFFLFLYGIWLIVGGRIRFGFVDRSGPTIRAAGFILGMPFVGEIFLAQMIEILFGADSGFSGSILFWFLVEIPAVIICGAIAYRLIIQTPGNLIRPIFPMENPEIDATKIEERNEAKATPPEVPEVKETKKEDQPPTKRPSKRTINIPTPPVEPAKPEPPIIASPPPSRPARAFPNVMSIKEAASYLGVSEDDVMKFIEDGKIAAARINYRYRISRSVLDDFISENGKT